MKETIYGPEAGTIYSGKLREVYQKLVEIPQKNPIAFEVSRAIKLAESKLVDLNTKTESIMSEYLLRDETGSWVVKEEVLKKIELALGSGLKLQPNEKGFVVNGDKEREKEYFSKIDSLFDEVLEFKTIKVDVLEKTIKVDGELVKLVNLLSEYFGVDQINFLEEIGILVNL